MRSRPAYRPLLLALLVSLAAHLALIGPLSRWLVWPADTPQLMTVELVRVEPPPPPPPKLEQPMEPAPQPPQPRKQPASPPPKPSRPPAAPELEVKAPEIPVPETSPAPILPPPSPAPAAVPEPGPGPQPAPVAEPAPVVQAETPAPPAVEEPKPVPPRHVEIDYEIVRKGGVAGVEHHRYEVREDGSYLLSSLAEPKGLLALALSDLVQQSEGVVTGQGLQPRHFLYHYGKNPDKAQRAVFDWPGGMLRMEVGSRRVEAPLTPGTQDLMSFMYQFMFVPPLQEMQLTITNGKRVKTYAYAFEGEETLNMPMGPLRTIRIARSSVDEEKIELWLAADYHYLPIKISMTDEDGTVTERIASRWHIEPTTTQ